MAVFKGEALLKDQKLNVVLQGFRMTQSFFENCPQMVLQMYIILLTWNEGKGEALCHYVFASN